MAGITYTKQVGPAAIETEARPSVEQRDLDKPDGLFVFGNADFEMWMLDGDDRFGDGIEALKHSRVGVAVCDDDFGERVLMLKVPARARVYLGEDRKADIAVAANMELQTVVETSQGRVRVSDFDALPTTKWRKTGENNVKGKVYMLVMSAEDFDMVSLTVEDQFGGNETRLDINFGR